MYLSFVITILSVMLVPKQPTGLQSGVHHGFIVTESRTSLRREDDAKRLD